MIVIFLVYLSFILNVVLVPTKANFIDFGIASFDFLEIVIWPSFLLTLIVFSRNKDEYIAKFNVVFSKKQIQTLVVFLIFALFSLILGLVNNNIYFFKYLRGFALFFVTFFIFIIQFNNFSNKEKKISKFLMIIFSIVCITVLLSYVSNDFTNWYQRTFLTGISITNLDLPSISGSTGTYSLDMMSATSLLYYFSVVMILLMKKKEYYIFAILGLISTIIFFHKPVVVSLLLGNIILVTLFLYTSYSKKSIKNVVKMISLFLTLVLLIILLLPQEVTDKLIQYIEYGWFNIGRGGYENDLSTGRFTIWSQYLGSSLNGYGFAPFGFGAQLVNALTENPHNYFVFMSFNFGILPTIIFFYFILSIIVDAIFTLKANQVRLSTVKYAVVFSLVVYLSTMLIQSMYGGTLDTIRSYIFLFSSSLAIIVHLKSSLKLDSHII